LSNLHAFNKELVFHVVYSSLPDWVVPAVSIVHELIQIRWSRKSLHMLYSKEMDFIIDAYVLVRISVIISFLLCTVVRSE